MKCSIGEKVEQGWVKKNVVEEEAGRRKEK